MLRRLSFSSVYLRHFYLSHSHSCMDCIWVPSFTLLIFLFLGQYRVSFFLLLKFCTFKPAMVIHLHSIFFLNLVLFRLFLFFCVSMHILRFFLVYVKNGPGNFYWQDIECLDCFGEGGCLSQYHFSYSRSTEGLPSFSIFFLTFFFNVLKIVS